MTTTLVSLVGSADIPINRPIIVVGRSADCDVAIDSKKVSRQHCCIASLQGKLLVRDLGSTNGIRVNGRRHEEFALVAGDELTIGNLRYRVESSVYKSAGQNVADKPPNRQGNLQSTEMPVMLEEEDSDDGMGTEMAADEQNPINRDSESNWLNVPDDVRLHPSSDDDIGIGRKKRP